MVFLGHSCLVRDRSGVRPWRRALLSQGSGIDDAVLTARHTRKNQAIRGNVAVGQRLSQLSCAAATISRRYGPPPTSAASQAEVLRDRIAVCEISARERKEVRGLQPGSWRVKA